MDTNNYMEKILEPMKCKNHKIHNTKEAKITLDVLLMRKTQKTGGKKCGTITKMVYPNE